MGLLYALGKLVGGLSNSSIGTCVSGIEALWGMLEEKFEVCVGCIRVEKCLEGTNVYIFDKDKNLALKICHNRETSKYYYEQVNTCVNGDELQSSTKGLVYNIIKRNDGLLSGVGAVRMVKVSGVPRVTLYTTSIGLSLLHIGYNTKVKSLKWKVEVKKVKSLDDIEIIGG